VHGEDELGLQVLLGQRAVRADHRELEHVGGRALDDRVDRQALAQRAHLVVAGPQLGDLPAPAEERDDVAVLLGALDRRGHERGDRAKRSR
jgi:hypothetical protein